MSAVGLCAAGSEFAYAVSDPMTGDHKDQLEIRGQDSVSGYYRMLDADGLIRTVKYKADPLSGFTADVDRSPIVARLKKRDTAILTDEPAAILDASPVAIMPAMEEHVLPLAKTTLLEQPAVAVSSASSISHVFKPRPVVMAAAAPKWQMWEPRPAIVATAKYAPLALPLDWNTAVPIVKKK